MNTKKMVTNAILIAIGALLRVITPMLGVPMQPDFSLIMLFIIMIYNFDLKTVLTCGIVVGVFAALTSKTPGGQIPNVLDKTCTSIIMYIILAPLRNKISKDKQLALLLPVGTVLSGTLFLLFIKLIAGLPGGQSFMTLFLVVVVPAIVLNTIIGMIFYLVVKRATSITGAYSIE